MKRRITLLLATLLLTACTTSLASSLPAPTATPATFNGYLARTAQPAPSAAPLITRYQARIQDALTSGEPLFLANLSDAADRAQRLAALDPTVSARTHTKDGQALRSEVFGVYPLAASEIDSSLAICQTTACYRVELYVYASNITLIALIAPDPGQVMGVNEQFAAQPQRIPDDLITIADQLAIASPLMRQTLGVSPTLEMLWHPTYKSSLRGTACERSKHLCVSSTVAWGEQAAWAIVDLTDFRVVGVEVTDLGASGRHAISEKRLQNEVVERDFCNRSTTETQGEWIYTYQLTNSDGLRITDVRWRGQPIISSISLVDIHITYNAEKAFGYADALGCPLFSSAVVVARDGPAVSAITEGAHSGIRLMQDFLQDGWPSACNYRYKQGLDLYDDGSFRVFWGSWGRGCGDNGIYRPVMRLALAETTSIAAWDGAAWSPWDTERWASPDSAAAPNGARFRIMGKQWAYELRPNSADGAAEQNDNAFLLATQTHAGEGESDLPTLGGCCETTYQQGPDQYLNDESLVNVPLTLWYIPQVQLNPSQCWADTTIENGVIVPVVKPCYAGPTFQRVDSAGGAQ